LRPNRTDWPALAAAFESLGTLLSSHRAITRVSLAALSFTLVIAFSQQESTQAGPEEAPLIPESLLPQNVGIAVATDDSITIPFQDTMDAASVESALQVLPAQRVELSWNKGRTELTIQPERLWRSDEQYLVIVGQGSETADGAALRGGRRYSFTTQTAPAVADFQVDLAGEALPPVELPREDTPSVRSLSAATTAPASGAEGTLPPTSTATEVSATSRISISFTVAMDRADVEDHFTISPAVTGELSWEGEDLVFTPGERLAPGGRYTISVIGSHDRSGNVLGGEGNFSFIVTAGAQLTRTEPGLGAEDVQPATVEMWFSQPMDVEATNAAFALTDTTTGALVGGHLNWNEAGTQLTYSPDRPFAGGRTFEVSLGDGARDADGNPVTASWTFATDVAAVAAPPAERSATSTRSAPAPAPAPVVPPPAPASDLAGYAVNQINAARAAYGFGPVVLDGAISAVAYAHAYDQAVNGYFSHYGLNGSTRESRLAAGGVSFGWSGENQCYLVGRTPAATLDWCHAQFMAEPYPGHWNHIGNILNPNARRVGVGIAQVGGKIVIVWDFTD
jgi:uncharacterized protein YkwD